MDVAATPADRGLVDRSGRTIGALLLVSIGLVGCGPSAPSPSEARGHLEHLIFIVQENRSFDHYFGTYPGADGIPMLYGSRPHAFRIPSSTAAASRRITTRA